MILVGAAGVATHFYSFQPLHQLLRIKTGVLEEHHEFTGFIATMFASFYGVFLAFTVISTEDRFLDIKLTIDKEAQILATLSRNARQLPIAFSQKVEHAAQAYVNSVIKDEWPLMHFKQESPKTLSKVDALWKIYREFRPENSVQAAWYRQSLTALDNFNNVRLERIYSRTAVLGTLSWGILIIGALYVCIFLFFFGTRHSFIRITIHSMMVSFVAMAIYLVYNNENPFSFPAFIQPTAYKVILDYSSLPLK